MTETEYIKKNWKRIVGIAFLLGVAGVLILSALTFSIAGGLGLVGPNFGHMYAIVVFSFLGCFLLGLSYQLAQGA